MDRVRIDAGRMDAGSDAGGVDAGADAGGMDAGSDAGGMDAGSDAGETDSGADAAMSDSGTDAGPLTCSIELLHTETGIRPRNLDWADLDGDMDDDLAAAFDTTPTIVYQNDRTSGFSPVWTEPVGGNCGVARWGDLNGDGAPDLAAGHCDGTAGGYSGFAHVFTSTAGALSTTAAFTTATGLWMQPIAWGDADGDTFADLLIGTVPTLGPNGRIYRGDGTTFSATPWWTDPDGLNIVAADLLDVDDDGDDELLITSWGAGAAEGIFLLRDDGSAYGRPWEHSAGTSPFGSAVGNVDTDTDTDIVVMDSGMNLSVYTDDGALPATTPTALGTISGMSVFSLALGDVDGDGDLDLGIARTGAADAVWMGDGAGGFSPGWTSTEVEDHTFAHWIEWDGDPSTAELAVAGPMAPLRIYGWVCR